MYGGWEKDKFNGRTEPWSMPMEEYTLVNWKNGKRHGQGIFVIS